MDLRSHDVATHRSEQFGGRARPPGPVRASGARAEDGDRSHAESPWHDDLLGGAWTWPSDDEDDARAPIAEIEAQIADEIGVLLGELVAELEA